MFSAFPSIDQFSKVVKRVRDYWNVIGKKENGDKIYRQEPLPKVKFLGTVKLHGTNAGMVLTEFKTFFQSRNTPLDPNDPSELNGFVGAMSTALKSPIFQEKLNQLKSELAHLMTKDSALAIYGEWCGKGVQKKVALSELEKMFVIFKVKIKDSNSPLLDNGNEDDSLWIPLESLKTNLSTPELKVFSILDFKTYEVEVDFEKPEYAQHEFSKLTMEVEECCPVGEYFGVKGVGEGIVWTPHASEKSFLDKLGYADNFFKTKGAKHSASRVKVIASVDIEKVESLNDFVENTCTEQRLEQGLDILKELKKPLDKTSMGDFIRWVFNDIMKEEMETVKESNLDPKNLGSPIAKKAKNWYMSKMEEK